MIDSYSSILSLRAPELREAVKVAPASLLCLGGGGGGEGLDQLLHMSLSAQPPKALLSLASRSVPGWSRHPCAFPASAFGHSDDAGDS